MNDLENRNAEATKEGLEGLEKRIRILESQAVAMDHNLQTIINMVSQLTQSNNLALQKIRGTGSTSE